MQIINDLACILADDCFYFYDLIALKTKFKYSWRVCSWVYGNNFYLLNINKMVIALASMVLKLVLFQRITISTNVTTMSGLLIVL